MFAFRTVMSLQDRVASKKNSTTKKNFKETTKQFFFSTKVSSE